MSETSRSPRLLITILASSVSLGIATGAVLWGASLFMKFNANQQARQLESQQQRLRQAEVLWEQTAYQSCLDVLQQAQIDPSSTLFPRFQDLQAMCQGGLDQARLDLAQGLATEGRFREAIGILATVQTASLHGQVADLNLHYSQRILDVAAEYYWQGKFDQAVYIASVLTADNPLYDRAQQTISAWQAEWTANRTHYNDAQAQFRADRLEDAITSLQQLTHPHWVTTAQPMFTQIEQRQVALNEQRRQGRIRDTLSWVLSLLAATPVMVTMARRR